MYMKHENGVTSRDIQCYQSPSGTYLFKLIEIKVIQAEYGGQGTLLLYIVWVRNSKNGRRENQRSADRLSRLLHPQGIKILQNGVGLPSDENG